LLSAASQDRLEALWILALTTGAREGELLGLKRGDVNLQAGTLKISRTVYNGAVGSPKSKRSKRIISLPKIALDALSRHIQRGDYAKDDWLFPSTAGRPIWYCTFLNYHWKPLLKRAGVEYKVFHTCRHYVASTLLAKGLPISSVARYLGHDEITLLKTYSQLLPDQMGAVASAMNEALG
jgi:integrase